VGSKDDVKEMRRYYEESTDPELAARCEARLKGMNVNMNFVAKRVYGESDIIDNRRKRKPSS
jgi:hypothetical protein